jgi:hypothetical protein
LSLPSVGRRGVSWLSCVGFLPCGDVLYPGAGRILEGRLTTTKPGPSLAAVPATSRPIQA